MKFSAALLITIFLSLLFYGFGIATAQYKIFPYEFIKSAKKFLIGESDSYTPPRSYYYQHRKSFFDAFGQENYDVVMIGDSITDEAEWEDLFPSLKIANRGISGDTTDGIVERIDSIVSTSANKAFIMVGLNDFQRGDSVDAVFSRYQNIVNALLDNRTTVYIQSTILGGKNVSHLNHSITALNEQLKLFTETDSNLIYVDINRNLSHANLLNAKYSSDGIHLNAEGYQAWRESISQYMRQWDSQYKF